MTTPRDLTTQSDVVSSDQVLFYSQVNGQTRKAAMTAVATFVNQANTDKVFRAGDTMTGPLNVPAGATGTQVPQAQEVVNKAALAASTGAGLVGTTSGDTVQTSLNALQLADYTALRAYAGNQKSVYVTGYLVSAAPSGIAGEFTRDDVDTTSADNGGTIIVASNGKRWKRVFDGAVNILWFGADRLGVADSLAAINAALATGRPVYAPEPTLPYIVSDTITITNEVDFFGDGKFKSAFKLVSATIKPVFHVACGNNSSIIGLKLHDIGIIPNGGAAVGDGLKITTTATNSAISGSEVYSIFISGASRDAVVLDGVIYMNTFRNITATGSVQRYGWWAEGALEVIYNTFQDLEVTNVENGAYAYRLTSAASQFRNLTADGCVYLSGAYSHAQGISVEGIHAATPASTYAIDLNSIMSAANMAIINVPNAKCGYGVNAFAVASINGIRVPDSGAGNQPNRILNLNTGQTGAVNGIKTDRAVVDKLEGYLSDAILNGFVFTACADVTIRGSSYAEDSWTPGYASWTTAPTNIGARYIKVGRLVTVTLYAQDGVAPAGATITGLPFAAISTQGFAVAGSSSDTSDVLRGSIIPSATSIGNIPAVTLTGNFWQMTATYFAGS